MKRNLFFIIIITLSLFISCNHNSGRSSLDGLAIVDIVDAQSVFISKGSYNRSARDAGETQKMFKITEDGYIEEIKYYDDDGNEMKIEQTPCFIQTINDIYIYVGFGYGEGPDGIDSSYLVRKSDGAVFDMEKAGNPKKDCNWYLWENE